jgi:hypothetical protein
MHDQHALAVTAPPLVISLSTCACMLSPSYPSRPLKVNGSPRPPWVTRLQACDSSSDHADLLDVKEGSRPSGHQAGPRSLHSLFTRDPPEAVRVCWKQRSSSVLRGREENRVVVTLLYVFLRGFPSESSREVFLSESGVFLSEDSSSSP